MTHIREPKVTVNKLPAVLPPTLDEQRVLVIGQKIDAGSATSGTVVTNITDADIGPKFGTKSMIGEQLRQSLQILRESGSARIPRIDALPFDDLSTGVAATGKITVTEYGGSTGLASTAGTITMIIGSAQRYSFSYTWAETDTIASIREGMIGVVNDNITCPFSAVVNNNDVEIHFSNDGECGNKIGIGFSGTTPDATAGEIIGNVVFAVTGFTGGTGNPLVSDVTDALNNITERYQTVCCPQEWAAEPVRIWLDSRWNVDNNILDGTAITTFVGTANEIIAYKLTQNSKSLVVVGSTTENSSTYVGPVYREFEFTKNCHIGVIRALRRTDNANLIRYVVNGMTFDLEGGPALASLPYHNTPLYNINATDSNLGFSDGDVVGLNDSGVTVMGNNISNTMVILGQMVTTYKTDSSGHPDPTWHFQNTVDTMSVAAEYIFDSFKKDYVQMRLTTGPLTAGRGVANEASILASFKKYYLELADLMIVRGGEDDIKFFLDSILIHIDLVMGAVTMSANLPIVVQLRSILANLTTTFNTGQ